MASKSGVLSCWGDNSFGQTNVPSGIFKDVAAGSRHSCALTLGGQAACWGDNSQGQSTPPSGRFKIIEAMGDHSCAVNFDGLATCWGTATGTPPAAEFVTISVGSTHACGVDYDSTATCWGDNSQGQLGAPNDAFDDVAVGNGYSCGLRSEDRSVVCWGDSSKTVAFDQNLGHYSVAAGPNSYCMVNRWHDNSFGETDVPPALDRIAMGSSHICGLDGGRLQCMGSDEDGQASPPAPYKGIGAFIHNFAAGDKHTCGTRQPGKAHNKRHMYCWGDNAYGQLNAPTGQYTKSMMPA
jgi:alpha-tubulin suppressor-like RCC1 family protein